MDQQIYTRNHWTLQLQGFDSVFRRVLLDLQTTSFEFPWFIGCFIRFIFEPALFCLLDMCCKFFGVYLVDLTFRCIPDKRLPTIFERICICVVQTRIFYTNRDPWFQTCVRKPVCRLTTFVSSGPINPCLFTARLFPCCFRMKDFHVSKQVNILGG